MNELENCKNIIHNIGSYCRYEIAQELRHRKIRMPSDSCDIQLCRNIEDIISGFKYFDGKRCQDLPGTIGIKPVSFPTPKVEITKDMLKHVDEFGRIHNFDCKCGIDHNRYCSQEVIEVLHK